MIHIDDDTKTTLDKFSFKNIKERVENDKKILGWDHINKTPQQSGFCIIVALVLFYLVMIRLLDIISLLNHIYEVLCL